MLVFNFFLRLKKNNYTLYEKKFINNLRVNIFYTLGNVKVYRDGRIEVISKKV